MSTAVAVTAAPRALLADSAVPKLTVAVVASVSSALVEPDANAPKLASIVEFELLNANCVSVALVATSLYVSPPAIVATLTVSGTAYTTCPDDLSSIVAPDGAVTVTPNSKAPVAVPSVIDVTVTLWAAESYVYPPTAPATSILPTYTRTAPVSATSVALVGLGSIPLRVSVIVDGCDAAPEYVRPAAKPRTL